MSFDRPNELHASGRPAGAFRWPVSPRRRSPLATFTPSGPPRSCAARRRFAGLLSGALLAGGSAPAAAAGSIGWGDNPGPFTHWWLAPDYSVHGSSIDGLFILIFWITMVVFVAVQIFIVYFAIKYRRRKDSRRKAVFTHGNTKLEMTWTIAPALILIVLSLWTKRAWDAFRMPEWANDPARAQVLVVGEQFKWNVVYPGPDGELGTYLSYPRPGDPKYRGKSYADALRMINEDVGRNPMGRVVSADPKVADPGRDDDAVTFAGRPLILPVDTNIDVHLAAKDVLHDFFLPNFRVKLDAVPGMRGHVYFRSKPEGQSTTMMEVAKVPADKPIWLDFDTPGVEVFGNPKRFQLPDPDPANPARVGRRFWLASFETLADGAKKRLLRKKVMPAQYNADPKLVSDEVEAFRADLIKAGITQLPVIARPHEIVCEELCGAGHFSMKGDLIIVSKAQYRHFILKEPPAPPGTPATAPAAAPAVLAPAAADDPTASAAKP
jgi:heme/copper-type cytochrome/quinol oxidase subunit 2